MSNQAPPETEIGSVEPAMDTKAERKEGSLALKRVLAPARGLVLIAQIMSAISAVLAIMPYIAVVKIGEILLSEDIRGLGDLQGTPVGGEVRTWVNILMITFAARLLIHFLALAITHVADIRVGFHIQKAIVARLARVPLSWFSKTTSGAVRKSLQDDIVTVHQMIAHQPVETVAAIVTPISLMVYAFIVDWRLGILSIAILPIYAAAMAWSMKGMGEKTVEMDKKLGRISSTMVEFVTGITVVKAFGRVGRAHGAYQRAANEFYDFYFDWVKPLIIASAVGSSIVSIPLILLVNIGGGAWMVNQGWVSPADVLVTALIALVIPHSLMTISNTSWAYQMAGAAAKRLVGMMDLAAIKENGSQRPENNRVVFDKVNYSYGNHQAAFDTSFELEPGTVTALVGPSGSGKSTVATLLARFDDPDSGTISIGGVPLPEIKDLYSIVGFVLQDPQLLEISIAENIALAKPEATMDEIRQAARTACVLEEIDALPDGFDTVYGSGSGLSGGQAQRIAIARALIVDAPVLILDEATALADPESQAQIQSALSELVKGRTVLVIAHRPESIKGADQIILLDHGRVLARGSHDDVLQYPHYRSLWDSAEARN